MAGGRKNTKLKVSYFLLFGIGVIRQNQCNPEMCLTPKNVV